MEKKALAVLLTGVLAAGILAGCGSTEEAAERPTMEETAEEASEEEAAPAEEEASAEEATAEEKGTITVAASPTPHAEILEAAKPILAEQGWNLEVTVFDDYIIPNQVVDSG